MAAYIVTSTGEAAAVLSDGSAYLIPHEVVDQAEADVLEVFDRWVRKRKAMDGARPIMAFEARRQVG